MVFVFSAKYAPSGGKGFCAMKPFYHQKISLFLSAVLAGLIASFITGKYFDSNVTLLRLIGGMVLALGLLLVLLELVSHRPQPGSSDLVVGAGKAAVGVWLMVNAADRVDSFVPLLGYMACFHCIYLLQQCLAARDKRKTSLFLLGTAAGSLVAGLSLLFLPSSGSTSFTLVYALYLDAGMLLLGGILLLFYRPAKAAAPASVPARPAKAAPAPAKPAPAKVPAAAAAAVSAAASAPAAVSVSAPAAVSASAPADGSAPASAAADSAAADSAAPAAADASAQEAAPADGSLAADIAAPAADAAVPSAAEAAPAAAPAAEGTDEDSAYFVSQLSHWAKKAKKQMHSTARETAKGFREGLRDGK